MNKIAVIILVHTIWSAYPFTHERNWWVIECMCVHLKWSMLPFSVPAGKV